MSLSSAVLDLLEEFVGAQPRSGSRLTFLCEVKVYYLTGSTEQTLYFSDGAYEDSTVGPYQPRFTLPDYRASLGLSDGVPGHAGTVSIGDVILANPDGYLDAYLDPDDYSWTGREVRILVGGHDWTRANFETLSLSSVESVGADLEEVRLKLTTPNLALDEPLVPYTYAGLGTALQGNGSSTVVTVGNEYNVGIGVGTSGFTLDFRMKASTISSDTALIFKRASFTGASDAGWCVWVSSTDILRFSMSDGTTNYNRQIGAAGDATDGEWHDVTVVVNRSTDEIAAWLDGSATATTDITGCGVVANDLDLTFMRRSDTAAGYYGGALDEVRIWNVAKRDDVLPSEVARDTGKSLPGIVHHSSIGGDGYYHPALTGNFKFDDGGLISSGTVTLNETEGPTLESVVFDASGDEIDWGSTGFDITTGGFVIGCWFKASTSDTGTSHIFGKRNNYTTADAGYAIAINSSGQLVGVISDGTNSRNVAIDTSICDPRDGRWWAAVLICPNDRAAGSYLNLGFKAMSGQDIIAYAPANDMSAVTSLTNGVALKAGRSGNNSNQFLGQISNAFWWKPSAPTMPTSDDLAVWMDYVWEPDEGDGSPPPNLDYWLAAASAVHYWPMDENTGTTINDVIGSTTRDGTATAGCSWQDRDATVANATWVTSYEGSPELAGRPKPMALGRCRDVPALMIEGLVDRIYQFNPDEVTQGSAAVRKARVDGLEMTLTTDYTVDLTNSRLDVSASEGPESLVTADVKGLKNTSGYWMFSTARIASYLLSDIAGLTLESGTIAALIATYPYTIGLWLGPDPYTTREILDALVQGGTDQRGTDGRLFYAELFNGNIRIDALRDVTTATPDLAIDSTYIVDEADGIEIQRARPPVWRVSVGYERVWADFSGGFLGGVSLAEQQRMSQPYRWIEFEDSNVVTKHSNAREVEVPTLIYHRSDAHQEARILFDLYRSQRLLLTVRLARLLFAVEIGDVVSVTDDRLGLSSGKKFIVIGYEYSLGSASSAPEAMLELWGGF